MNRFLHVSLLCSAFFLSVDANAQVKGSENSFLTQTVSGTEIEIKYSRPSVRERDPLFGGLEKWDHVWTPGANMASTIKFSKDVKLNGVDVEAGKYSLWFHLVEAGPWELMLHPDTILGHLPAPKMEEASVIVEVQTENKSDFTETLLWNIEHIRASGASLEFMWGTTRVPIELKVELGYKYVFEPAEVRAFEGTWLKDTSMSRPADSTIAQYKAESPDEVEMIDEWIASYDKMETIHLRYDQQTGMLLVEKDDVTDADKFYSSVLIQRGDGIFSSGTLMNGELAFVGDWSFWEFEFDDQGMAQVNVERSSESDEIMSRSTRINE